MDELQSDPNFPYYVGRLMGASEMTSHWLMLQQNPDAQEMGRGLATVVNWFLTDVDISQTVTDRDTLKKALSPPKT
jgi:hypothetical protein